jgi:predicted secreted protein
MSQQSSLVYGGDMMLFLASGLTGTVLPIAFSTSAKLDIILKTHETSSKDSGAAEEKQPNKYGWNVSSDALFAYSNTGSTQTFAHLFSIFTARCPIKMAFAVKCGTSPSWSACASDNFGGNIYLTSLSINAADNANVTYSMAGEGTGTLSFA